MHSWISIRTFEPYPSSIDKVTSLDSSPSDASAKLSQRISEGKHVSLLLRSMAILHIDRVTYAESLMLAACKRRAAREVT